VRRLYLLLLYLSVFLFPPLFADSVTVAVFKGASPMLFTDHRGEADGLFPELARMIFPEPDEVRFITGLTFEEAYGKVKSGEIDLMPALIKTPARERDLKFNREVPIVSWSEVFLRPDGQMTSVFDLQGSPVALMKGGQNGLSFIRLMKEFNIPFDPVYFEDFPSMVEAVLEGRVDAMVSFSTFAMSEQRVKSSGIVFAPTQAFFATALEGRVDLLETIDERLKLLKEDPDSAYYRALERWLHTEVREMIPRWVRPFASAGLFLLITVLLILYLQRRHLARVEGLVKKQNRIIHASEKRYELLVENSNDLIWMEDREGRLTFLNGRAASLLGIPRDELPGGSLDPLIVSQDRKDIRQIRERAFGGEPVLYELHVRQPSGELRTLSVTTAPVLDEGLIGGAVSFGRDITEQKNLEKQILRSQRLETLGSLTSGIAHDFNNLLTPIIGYGEILRMKTGAEDERYPMVTHILDAGSRARELIGKLMAFSRKQEMKYESICLNRLVENFSPLLEKSIPGTIAFKAELDPGLPAVHADRGQLEQVLLNLVVNARDAMPEGGTISVSTTTTKSMDAQGAGRFPLRQGSYSVLRVEDSGCGISEENIEKIFDPFFSTKGEKGTGLGLSTSYGIIKQHGGYIFASSRPGEGTTFSVYLPVVPDSLS
jgi:PAS domain S-box-containing protein